MTVYVPTSTGGFSDFPWDPSSRHVASYAIVPYLSYHDNFAEDFPGTPAHDFALIANSIISLSAGNHQFCTNSDDGSWLYVDGSILINNQGIHSSVSACQYSWLNEGIHTITVKYFKHTGSSATLEVSMDGALIVFEVNGKSPIEIGKVWDKNVKRQNLHDAEVVTKTIPKMREEI